MDLEDDAVLSLGDDSAGAQAELDSGQNLGRGEGGEGGEEPLEGSKGGVVAEEGGDEAVAEREELGGEVTGLEEVFQGGGREEGEGEMCGLLSSSLGGSEDKVEDSLDDVELQGLVGAGGDLEVLSLRDSHSIGHGDVPAGRGRGRLGDVLHSDVFSKDTLELSNVLGATSRTKLSDDLGGAGTLVLETTHKMVLVFFLLRGEDIGFVHSTSDRVNQKSSHLPGALAGELDSDNTLLGVSNSEVHFGDEGSQENTGGEVGLVGFNSGAGLEGRIFGVVDNNLVIGSNKNCRCGDTKEGDGLGLRTGRGFDGKGSGNVGPSKGEVVGGEIGRGELVEDSGGEVNGEGRVSELGGISGGGKLEGKKLLGCLLSSNNGNKNSLCVVVFSSLSNGEEDDVLGAVGNGDVRTVGKDRLLCSGSSCSSGVDNSRRLLGSNNDAVVLGL